MFFFQIYKMPSVSSESLLMSACVCLLPLLLYDNAESPYWNSNTTHSINICTHCRYNACMGLCDDAEKFTATHHSISSIYICNIIQIYITEQAYIYASISAKQSHTVLGDQKVWIFPDNSPSKFLHYMMHDFTLVKHKMQMSLCII